jgi:pimeloyl-ACP methyl ester carboxylesterase
MGESVDLSKWWRRLSGGIALFVPSTGLLLDSPVPLVSRLHFREFGVCGETLIVLLPGIQDTHDEFAAFGFAQAVHDRGIKADVLAVDAHIGYYMRQTVLDRLKTDIVDQAKASGYRRIWLAGTSLGGLGALLYASRYGEEIEGVFAMAPYLGDKAFLKKLKDPTANGLLSPQIAGESLRPRAVDFQIHLWRWLSRYFDEQRPSPHLYLGYGKRDKFAYGHDFLAEKLPKDNVIVIPGGHDWKTWSRLWTRFLENISPNFPFDGGSLRT